MRFLEILIISTIWAQQAYAETFILSSNKVILVNEQCKSTDSCNLLNIKLHVEDIKLTSRGEVQYGTRALLSYETKKIEYLEDYGIVQFIRGCQFHTTESGDVYGGAAVPAFFGKKYYPYRFENWVIDSLDRDPLYNSWVPKNKSHSRHDLYRWSMEGPSFDSEGDRYFWKERPARAELYVTDRPGVTSYDSKFKRAKNISLQYKSCVYKMEDIKPVMGPRDLDFQDALVCVDWDSSFIYNHKMNKFEKSREVDSFCK